MKKILLFIILIFVFITTLSTGERVAYADNTEKIDDIQEKLETTTEEQLDSLNFNEFEKFVQDIDEGNNLEGGIKQYINGIINGEFKFNLKDMLKMIINVFVNRATRYIPLVITIIIISILCGMTGSLSSGFQNQSTNKMVTLTCTASIVVLIISALTSLVTMATTLINNISKLVSIVFPILLTLVTAVGSVVSASVYQPLLPLFSTLIIGLISGIIIPCFIAMMVFNIVGNLSESIKLEKLTKVFKNISEWLLGITFGMFIMYISVQGITGVSIDAISVKATKFALSSYVPILGGYISDGFDLVTASCLLIKNAVGVSGIIVLFLTIIVPLMELIAFSVLMKLSAAIVEPLGEKKISDMLEGVSQGISLLITAILGIAFMLFIILMLIIYTFNMGVI